jgi:hypothetical protein
VCLGRCSRTPWIEDDRETGGDVARGPREQRYAIDDAADGREDQLRPGEDPFDGFVTTCGNCEVSTFYRAACDRIRDNHHCLFTAPAGIGRERIAARRSLMVLTARGLPGGGG